MDTRTRQDAVARFNALPYGEAAELVQRCAAIPAWSSDVLDGRPFGDLAELLARAGDLAEAWTEAEVAAALAQHPRIGERSTAGGAEAAMSADEQAAVDPEAEVTARIGAGNAAYEDRFGHVFLIRAKGRTASQILAELERRLGNDDVTELAETTRELREIALLRLEAVLV